MECVNSKSGGTCSCAACAAVRRTIAMGAVFTAATNIAQCAVTDGALTYERYLDLKYDLHFLQELVETTIAERGLTKPPSA